METLNFNNLIILITNKNLFVNTSDLELELGNIYEIAILENDVQKFAFDFNVPKNIDKLVSSFITQFCNKFKDKLDEFKDKPYCNLSHHYKSKYGLMNEIENNFTKDDFIDTYCKYGFYPTNYGIGVFTQFLNSESVIKIANNLDAKLNTQNIPFKNELSKKEFVYRWLIKINKGFHNELIKTLTL